MNVCQIEMKYPHQINMWIYFSLIVFNSCILNWNDIFKFYGLFLNTILIKYSNLLQIQFKEILDILWYVKENPRTSHEKKII